MPRASICLGCERTVLDAKHGYGVGCGCYAKRTNRREARRGTAKQKVWDSAAHKRTRRIVLARDGFTCLHCGHHDPTGKTLVLDHEDGVEAILARGDNPHNPDECQTLCQPCSGKKDGRLAHRRGGSG